MSETVDRIRAEAHSDDQRFQHRFDATEWFDEASAEDIFALAKCGWGGDYAADAVVQYMSHHGETPLETMLTYLTVANQGFECHVDAGDAMTYLKEARPEIHDCITRELGDAGSPPHSQGHPTDSKGYVAPRLTHQECGCRIGQSVHTCDLVAQPVEQAARAIGVRVAFGIEWHGDGRVQGNIAQEWSVAAEDLPGPLRSQVLALAHQAAGQQEAPAMDCGCPLGTKNKQHTC